MMPYTYIYLCLIGRKYLCGCHVYVPLQSMVIFVSLSMTQINYYLMIKFSLSFSAPPPPPPHPTITFQIHSI